MDVEGRIVLAPEGLYCPSGDFFIDPVRPVARALITHGHGDHARSGHGSVLATAETIGIMKVRYGAANCGSAQAIAPGETVRLGEADVSFHPAGHVYGSAQVRMGFPSRARDKPGLVVVVSGDYKREPDPTCRPFEVVACDVFITEATFGLPVFRHSRTEDEIAKLLASQRLFPERTHLVGAYVLGKAQRVMALLRQAGYDRPIYVHGAAVKLTEFYESEGIRLGDVRRVQPKERAKLGGEIVICPPSALQDLWARKFPDPVVGFASGWMRVRNRARQKGVELPLVISDHADWEALCTTVVETGCSKLLVTHGETEALVYWARSQGIEAEPLHILGYGDEDAEADVADEAA